jgi:hypothetical protein
MNKKNEYKPPFGLDITHPGMRLIFGLLGAAPIGIYFVEDRSLSDLIRTIVSSAFFLMFAVFAPQIARRAQRKRMENPKPWTAITRHPLRGLISTILLMALLACVMAVELLVSDSMTTGILVLCGGASLFLWSFIHAKLYDRCSYICRALFAGPFSVGGAYAICRLGCLNEQLSNPEATFPWGWFGLFCVVLTMYPLLTDRQQQNKVENTDNTDSPSEIDADSAVTEPPTDE